MSTRFKTF